MAKKEHTQEKTKRHSKPTLTQVRDGKHDAPKLACEAWRLVPWGEHDGSGRF